MAQDSPKRAQDSPRNAQGSRHMAPRRPKRAQASPKTAQDGPRMAQDGPRWPQDGPRWPQEGPKINPRWPQDGFKMVMIRSMMSMLVKIRFKKAEEPIFAEGPRETFILGNAICRSAGSGGLQPRRGASPGETFLEAHELDLARTSPPSLRECGRIETPAG